MDLCEFGVSLVYKASPEKPYLKTANTTKPKRNNLRLLNPVSGSCCNVALTIWKASTMSSGLQLASSSVLSLFNSDQNVLPLGSLLLLLVQSDVQDSSAHPHQDHSILGPSIQ